MTFSDFLYGLLHGIFKRRDIPEENDAQVWFRGLGPLFDDARQTIFTLRRQALIATAQGEGLDGHGKDRMISRYAGEDDEAFRRRLFGAYDFYAEGGSLSGMRKALKALGYPNVEIYPLWREKYKWRFLTGETLLDSAVTMEPTEPDAKLEYLGRWAQFLVKLNIEDQPFLEQQYAVARAEINRVKPPDGKLYALLFSISAVSMFQYRVRESIRLLGQFAQEVNPGVAFMSGRRTLGADPAPLVLDSTGKLDNLYVLNGYKEWPAGTWFMKDDRNLQEMRLDLRFASQPEIVTAMDGRFWLNGKLAMGGARRLTAARASVRTRTGTVVVLGHAGRDGYRVISGTPRAKGFLNAFYSCLDGAVQLDGRLNLAPDRMLDGWEQLSDGQAVHRLTTRFSFPYSFGHGPDMGTGLWRLDGGGPRYAMDGRINMSPVAMMDGSLFLNSQNRMEWLTILGDSMYRLGGSKKMGGDGILLDGQMQMRPQPAFHRLGITTWKNSRLLEKVVV